MFIFIHKIPPPLKIISEFVCFSSSKGRDTSGDKSSKEGRSIPSGPNSGEFPSQEYCPVFSQERWD